MFDLFMNWRFCLHLQLLLLSLVAAGYWPSIAPAAPKPVGQSPAKTATSNPQRQTKPSPAAQKTPKPVGQSPAKTATSNPQHQTEPSPAAQKMLWLIGSGAVVTVVAGTAIGRYRQTRQLKLIASMRQRALHSRQTLDIPASATIIPSPEPPSLHQQSDHSQPQGSALATEPAEVGPIQGTTRLDATPLDLSQRDSALTAAVDQVDQFASPAQQLVLPIDQLATDTPTTVEQSAAAVIPQAPTSSPAVTISNISSTDLPVDSVSVRELSEQRRTSPQNLSVTTPASVDVAAAVTSGPRHPSVNRTAAASAHDGTLVNVTDSERSPRTQRLPQVVAVAGLLQEIRNPDPVKRGQAIWQLGQWGDTRAVQPLVDLMLEADSQQRSLILSALSEIGTRTLKPMGRALVVALHDENSDVRKNAMRDLTKLYDLVAQMSQVIQKSSIDDPDAEVRETANWALKQLNRIRPPAMEMNLTASPNSTIGPENPPSP
jgi:hypothetical protein